jgi:hypothetical protein
MHHDGSNSARARSARIRTAHEYEATQLDTMRRNSVARPEPSRVPLAARIASAFRRTPRVEPGTSLHD